jgi:hypothetical protein
MRREGPMQLLRDNWRDALLVAVLFVLIFGPAFIL